MLYERAKAPWCMDRLVQSPCKHRMSQQLASKRTNRRRIRFRTYNSHVNCVLRTRFTFQGCCHKRLVGCAVPGVHTSGKRMLAAGDHRLDTIQMIRSRCAAMNISSLREKYAKGGTPADVAPGLHERCLQMTETYLSVHPLERILAMCSDAMEMKAEERCVHLSWRWSKII
jgi:hypothetical protein